MLNKVIPCVFLFIFIIVMSQQASAAVITKSNTTSLNFLNALNPQNHIINVTNVTGINDANLTATFSGFLLGSVDVYFNGVLIGTVNTTDTSPKVFTGVSARYTQDNNNITYDPSLVTTVSLLQTDLTYVQRPYVQSGEFKMTGLNNNVTILPINTSMSFIVISNHMDGAVLINEVSALQVMAEIINSTTISFSNFNATANPIINWYIIEDSNLAVQRGVFNYDTTSKNITVAINTINKTNSFPIISNKLNIFGTSGGGRGFWSASLNTTGILNLTRGLAGTAGSVGWQVISWSGANVQFGELDIRIGQTTLNSNLQTPINLSNTFIVATKSVNSTHQSTQEIRVSFTNATTVNGNRINNTQNTSVLYYVVSHPDLNVQNITYSLGAVNSNNDTFNNINVLKTFSVKTFNTNTESTSSFVRTTIFDRITNNTNINFRKGQASNTQSITYFVVEFIPSTAINDPCAYTSGHWTVPCFCNVTSNVALTALGGKKNLIINGSGTMIINANITNVGNITRYGLDGVNRCTIIRINGGGWR